MALTFRSFARWPFAAVVLSLPATALPAEAPVDTYRVVATYPHAATSYTEGFFYRNGLFYEGTGLRGQSEILVTDLTTGQVRQRRAIAPEYFGEGIVDFGPNLYEWTWQSHVGWVYDSFTLAPIRQFTYTGEGWGMTRDATHIITSDGTAVLRFRDPKTFAEVRHITVRDAGKPVDLLNELEYIHGEIYANVWHTDRIARISPKDGRVLRWIDLSGIEPEAARYGGGEAVLNGIAWDAQHERLFVTGKQWPHIFEIRIVPRDRR